MGALALCLMAPVAVGIAAEEPTGSIAVSSPVPPQKDLTELSLEELSNLKVQTVYGASKHTQKLTEAPSSVSIITRDDIQKYGYQTLADILRGVRGFYVTYDRAYSYIGIRGVNRPGDFGGRLLITVDGHRINDPIYDQAFNGTEGILDVDLIERVEVIRGPGSAIYGNNAFFGVINIITRRGRDVRGTELSGAVASYDTYTGRLSYGNRLTNGLEVLVSGTIYESEGHDRLYYPEFSAINNGVAEGLDGDRAFKLFSTISYHDLTLQGAFVDRKKDLPTADYGTVFNQAGTFNIDQRAYLDLKYTHDFEADWQILARTYYDHYRFDGNYILDYNDPLYPGLAINRDLAQAESLGTELQLSKTFFEKHLLTGGAEYKHDFRLDQKNFDRTAPFTTYADIRTSADTVGMFLQDEYSICTNLILNAGLRYDRFSTFGDTLNPRAGLIYSPIEKTTFKLLYGQAYRAPNAYESAYSGIGYKANPNLSPEEIKSYEWVWEQDLNPHLRLSSALFYNQIKHLISQQTDPVDGTLVFQNTDSVDARGVEAELEGSWAHGLRSRLSYTFTDAIDNTTGRVPSNSPEHLAKFNLSVPVYLEKVFASVELQGMSRRETVQNNATGAFWVANATLFSRELIKGLELSASVANVFDKKYADPVSPEFVQDTLTQDGRRFWMKLTYRF